MLVKESAITKETREFLKKDIDKHFEYKEGSDLQSIIKEVLKNKDIFTSFALYFKPRRGLELGRTSFWDDIMVYGHYGLILDFDHIPRELKIFNYETTSPMAPMRERKIEVILGYGIIEPSGGEGVLGELERLTPETFIEKVNDALKNPKGHIIEFDDGFKIVS